jgi:hypothetical protein
MIAYPEKFLALGVKVSYFVTLTNCRDCDVVGTLQLHQFSSFLIRSETLADRIGEERFGEVIS